MLSDDKNQISMAISIFTIVFTTTFLFHKFVMESRIKVLEEKVTTLKYDYQAIRKNALELEIKYSELMESKGLNK